MNKITASLAAMLLMLSSGPALSHGDCPDCGTVSSIEQVEQKGSASGVGAVIGAVVGGVAGHQFGSGRGNDAATAAGAVGGAVVGHQAEKHRNATHAHKVTVKMDDGSTRVVHVAAADSISIGTRVRVSGNNLELR